MGLIRVLTKNRLSVRMSKDEFEELGLSKEDFDVSRFMNELYNSDKTVRDFLDGREDPLNLFATDSKENPSDFLMAIFYLNNISIQNEMDAIERLHIEFEKKNDRLALEELGFQLFATKKALEIIAQNQEMESEEYDDDYDDEDFDEYDDYDDEGSDDWNEYEKELDIHLSHLSFESNSGRNVLWFVDKVKELNFKSTKINVYMAHQKFCIIIPCEQLNNEQCAKILSLANEAQIETCYPMKNLSLLEHEKPITDEAIRFAGENDIVLKQKCLL